MENFKSGFISIIGRTNAGKSTLLNALAQEKVAITTYKSQTTRTAIKAIVNRKNSQMIFIDTPGIHKATTKLGKTMIETAFGVILDTDLVLFLIDGTYGKIGKGDKVVLDKIKETNKKVILVINKIDLMKKEEVLKIIDLYKDEYSFTAIIPISAEKQKNTEELLNEIEKHMPVGPAYYNIDEYTDQTARQLVEETIREKALKLLDDEIPHGIYVEVEKMSLRKTQKNEDIYNTEAVIYCLRESHKGIIIGKNGEMLKKIGTYARQDLENMLQTKFNLKIWVKVNKNWLDNPSIVKRFENK